MKTKINHTLDSPYYKIISYLNPQNMEFKQIQELLKSINKSNIGTFKYKQGDFELVIKQQTSGEAQIIAAPLPAIQAPVYAAPAPVASAPTEQQPKAQEAPASITQVTIKSPMIGTFYRSPSPDKPSFVNVGDKVTAGQTVCIIEAMKLFNEIESDVTGTIVKVLVDDASPVEYDQPLFIVEP